MSRARQCPSFAARCSAVSPFASRKLTSARAATHALTTFGELISCSTAECSTEIWLPATARMRDGSNSRSSVTHATCPFLAAMWSAVSFCLLSPAQTSMPWVARRRRAMSVCPRSHATMRGVFPVGSVRFTSTPYHETHRTSSPCPRNLRMGAEELRGLMPFVETSSDTDDEERPMTAPGANPSGRRFSPGSERFHTAIPESGVEDAASSRVVP
mmetsp:Transcript_473/g.1091  ORF Transcript_473/g.1091 Transcript_473/m.1091 type:complete len:214 (-) Transcript_473:41-682(-)